jgi:hypothetical protein
MESMYSDRLREVIALIVNNKAPKSQALTKARALKAELSASWHEIQDVIDLLDATVRQFVSDEDWVDGFWIPEEDLPPLPRFSGMRERTRISMSPSRDHILEVARKVASDGIVNTADVIRQLRMEGDKRPEKNLAIGVGNVLTKRGWQKLGVGRYRTPEAWKEEKEKGVTKPLL